MFRKSLVICIIILFLGMSIYPTLAIDTVKESVNSLNDGNTLYVGGDGPGNYTKIQDAIDNASDGDTVFVYDDSSPYYETVRVGKSISLIGEAKETTIIIGDENYIIVDIFADWVNINGFTIESSEGKGVGIWVDSSFCSIISNNIINISIAITLYEYGNHIISDNLISLNSWVGINIQRSNNNTITNNIFTNNEDDGIYIASGENNTITDNIFTNNDCGISIFLSNKNIIINNSFFNDGLYIGYTSCQNSIYSNFINGKPLVYLEDQSDEKIIEAGEVILVNCDNITVENLSLSNVYAGIILWETNNCILRNNNCSNNSYGIDLTESFGNTIIGNTILNVEIYGITISKSNSNILHENSVLNSKEGIVLGRSDSNNLQNNNLLNNKNGFSLYDSYNNTLQQNNLLNNKIGIHLSNSGRNTFQKNNFINNERDVDFYIIYFRNFLFKRNIWRQNYWNESRILPKPIFGIIVIRILFWFFEVQWFQLDWHPAKEPYDIEV